MEVVKKIVESGWIIGETEISEVLQFLKITESKLQGPENMRLKKFIDKMFAELNLDAGKVVFYQG